jgi:LEA14-like dessication related protein
MNRKIIIKEPKINCGGLFIILCLITILLLPSCRMVKGPEFKSLENFKLAQFGLSESTITADLVFFNPNKYGYKIRSFEADIQLNKRLLGRSVSNKEIEIDKLAPFRIPVEMKVNMRNLPLNTLNLFTKDSVTVNADGFVLVGIKGVYKQIPIHYEGKQKVSF